MSQIMRQFILNRLVGTFSFEMLAVLYSKTFISKQILEQTMQLASLVFRLLQFLELIRFVYYSMGRAMRKRVFGHMRTAKAQISLRIRAVWSGPSLSANRIIGYYEMYEWRAKAPDDISACARWSWICAFCACSKTHFCLVRPVLCNG